MWEDYSIDYGYQATNEITLPYRFRGRHYQQELLDEFFAMIEGNSTTKMFAVCWHRRAGKDVTFWQCIVAAALMEVGDYYYLLPQQNQAERVIWNGVVMDSNGIACKFMDFIPPSEVKHAHKQGHRIELANGSNIHIGGSDNYESFIGGNAKGIVYSEWSITNPAAQEYFKPMIRQNNGWEMYCFTPRGKNHAYDTLNAARKEDSIGRWFVSTKTIEETWKEDGSPVIKPSDVEADIKDGMDEAIARQEYYLDFNAAVKGVVYGRELEVLRNRGGVKKIKLDTSIPVLSFWDLGISKGNATSVWLMQPCKNSNELNMIAYFEAEDQPLTYFLDNPLNKDDRGIVNEFCDKHGLTLGKIYFPHDGNNRDLIAGEKRHETIRNWGYQIQIVPVIQSIHLGIDATKKLFTRLNFHEEYCFVGLNHLERYRYKIDKVTGRPNKPLHDDSSNCADALRQMGQAYMDNYVAESRQHRKITLTKSLPKTSYSPTGSSGYNAAQPLYRG